MDLFYTVTLYAVTELNTSLVRRFIYLSLSVFLFTWFGGLKLFTYIFSTVSESFGYCVQWFEGLNYTFIVSTIFDDVTLLTLCVILGVASTIIIFSSVYMLGDPRLYEFMLLLMIFVASMLMMIGASSYLWFITFWEGIGICSFCLISFWCMRLHAVRASLQAMLVNKLGDSCMLVAAVCIVALFNGDDMLSYSALWEHYTWIFLILLLGACSKSALGLFHYWLPYAMEGPTSVSALIHAATLVTAGLFLVMKAKFVLLNGLVTILMLLLGFAGIMLLALIAVDQFDVKKLIAYSTLSQISYMFVTIAMYAIEVSLLYLLVHALFKSLMFMASGGIIHGVYDQQDMRMFGGLAKAMPISMIYILYASASMAGLIGTIGCYSKELIVELFGNTYAISGWWVSQSFLIGLVATIAYSGYLLVTTFLGGGRIWSIPRSSDDVGLFVCIILLMQTIGLLISGDYLNTVVNSTTGEFISPDGVSSISTVLASNVLHNDYSFAGIVLAALFILRLEHTRLAATRLHAFKWLYDRVINTLFILAHEGILSWRSDLIRLIFYIRYSMTHDRSLSLLRLSYPRVMLWLLLAAILFL